MAIFPRYGPRTLRDPAARFDDLQQMFHRFDFDGSGNLGKEECEQLVLYMLRLRRDELQPSGPALAQPRPGVCKA